MEVGHFLTSVGAHVCERPIAALVDTQERGHTGDELQQGLALARLPLVDVVEGDDVLPRYHQYVLGSFGIDIAECDEEVVFENDIAGYDAACYPTKNTVVH